VKDLADKRFGKLIATNALRRSGTVTKRLCFCDCGEEAWVPTNRLTTGHTKSCGCWQSEFRKLEPGVAVRNQILDGYKRDAAKRNFVWSLTDRQFEELIAGHCYYCRRPPSSTRTARRMNGDLTYNGIDRMDNNLGYTFLNTVSCCKVCNRAKSDMSFDDFMEWVADLSEAHYERQ